MSDTMREVLNAHISKNPRSYVDFADYRDGFMEGYQVAQADALALVGELVACIEPNGAFDAVIAKAQAFMEGLDNATK